MNELVQKLIADVPVPIDSYLDQDAEIIDIFIEEAAEIIVELKSLFVTWQEDLHDIETIKTIRRHFHTLKGSGRMVGANQAGELAWCVEDLFNSILHDTARITLEIQQYCVQCFKFYTFEIYPHIEKHQALDNVDIRPLLLIGKQLKDQKEIEHSLQALYLDHVKSNDQELEESIEVPVANSNTVDVESVSIYGMHISQETLAIYLDEAYEHLTTITTYLNESVHTEKQTASLVRSIHTLKGSSGMAQIEPLCETSANVELSLNQELQEKGELHLSLDLLKQFSEFLTYYLDGLKNNNEALRKECLDKFELIWDSYSQYIKVVDDEKPLINEIVDLGVDNLLDVSEDFTQIVWDSAEEYLTRLVDESEILIKWAKDKQLFDIEDYLVKLREGYILLLKIAFADYDLLKKVSPLLDDFHDSLIIYFDYIASGQISQTLLHKKAELQHVIEEIGRLYTESEYFEDKSKIASSIKDENVTQQVIQKLSLDEQTISNTKPNVLDDAELIDIFLDEAEELVEQIEVDLSAFQSNFENIDALKNLMRYLHTLKGSANMIQAENFGLIAHHLESVYERLIYRKIIANESMLNIIRLVQDQFAERIDVIRHSKVDYSSTHAVSVIDSLKNGTYVYDTHFDSVNTQQLEAVTEQTLSEDIISDEVFDLYGNVTSEFKAHALGQLNNLTKAFDVWCEERQNRSLLLALQRVAHILYDDAKAIEKGIVFELSELLVDAFEKFALYQVKTDIYDGLVQTNFATIERILTGEKPAREEVDKVINDLKSLQFNVESADSVDESFIGLQYVVGDGTEPPPMMGQWDDSSEQSQSNEMIRVSSTLVEKVSNLTAESSINRSRVEMGLNQFTSTLSEMELAIKRLSDQLRRMEGELETQILAKHSIEGTQYEEFDPLEMDQYSSLNQLSKSLAESASDLLDFKATLADKVRDSESLLLEQARIQTDVQDQLTRVKLVTFSLIESRLQRLVRQTSTTVNRSVNFEIVNSRLEIDRSILDKLVAPLEHMIRNAIDHGIESVRERLQSGKASDGNLKISLSRQGTDILIDITDDGRGIDVARVRRKAESLGLISESDNVTDEDVLQYIFHSGFSTAREVTQVSGRGVGLDVVRSDIRAMGGSISVISVTNEGTKFSLRIPTIVAVTDALMVKAGEQQFALPLSQIERIVRVEPQVLHKYFSSISEFCQIAGGRYRLRYISDFLGYAKEPNLNTTESLPVLIIKDHNNQSVALLVDQLIGSRVEIVVKPLNSHLKDIEILSGATILGDGKVCLILDGQTIARTVQNSQRRFSIPTSANIERQNTDVRHVAMIVDDSVTVRKVTSRLLEREGYEVVTAKDGIDAIEKLENIRPDIMLLDIEMPRMDGFEVANQVRHHAIHKDLPIIMITSRTGEKHRERALSLGVNYYMGKPFQEDALLEQIEVALKVPRGKTNE
ncbi:hybrid sensor histidine kinase/response regulator [Acinetobacter nectaris]|uniref:hybrid sensor histidine kinase/response regulator n=1 Tax=Acinetobacter nectaris TaxID=1219382 RepID=UPI001F024504|nr:Hpt domain-containing protein [Acinetobacter nectaris]MCF9035148.1 Hpt domain-containing protein [Acinetobacter nectaris]